MPTPFTAATTRFRQRGQDNPIHTAAVLLFQSHDRRAAHNRLVSRTVDDSPIDRGRERREAIFGMWDAWGPAALPCSTHCLQKKKMNRHLVADLWMSIAERGEN